MLHSNLLPNEQKKIIVLEQWLYVIRFFGIAGSGILIVGIILLAPSYLPLYFQNQELERSLSLQRQAAQHINSDDISQRVLQVKAVIASLHQAMDRPSGVLPIFDLLTAFQQGIVITTFSVDKNANISLMGNAATRNDLLALEQRLRDSSKFQDIASPLANIIQEANINFNFKGTLRPAYAL